MKRLGIFWLGSYSFAIFPLASPFHRKETDSENQGSADSADNNPVPDPNNAVKPCIDYDIEYHKWPPAAHLEFRKRSKQVSLIVNAH